LRLLRQLLSGGQCSHLLIIGTFRNNEAAELHPLLLMIGELRKAAVPIDEIVLKPLDLEAVTGLVADTLRLEPVKVAPLAATLLRKTNGNPFFLQQFLTALAEQQLLRFDATARQWIWDDARIEVAVAADNVVDLLVARLRRLPAAARRVLTLSACVGQEFDLATLSLIWQGPTADLTTGLWEALREGLVIPLDASYRYLAESAKANNEIGEAIHSRYRFLHDRVQQDAYELIEAGERSEIHLRIGRLLLGAPDGQPSDESLFEVVRQMNLGHVLVTSNEERRQLARFNLRAGLRMASSGAHGSALPLLRRCLDLLGPSAWDGEHELTHRAHLAQAECEFMSGNTAGALQLLDAVEARSRTVLERVAGREIRIVILASAVTGLLDAVACGVETARMLGAEFPTDDADLGPAIGAELGVLKAMLATRTVESLLDLPTMADPEKRALVDVLFKTNAPAFMAKPQVSVLIGLKAVRLAIEHGNAPMSPYFYDNYGIINNATGGDLDVSFRFGQLGIDLLQKPGYAEIEASTHFLFGAFNSHWRRPIAVSRDHLRHSVKAGLESGAYLHVAWAELIGMYYRLYGGESIPDILAEVPRSMDLLRRSENPVAQTLLKVLEQTLKAFSGATASPISLDGDGFDEAGLVESAKKIRVLWVYYHVLKIPLVFHSGDFKRTLELTEAALPLMPGMFFVTEHALYRSLARSALAAEETGASKEAALATLRQEEEAFRKWAEASPANHAHRHALVSAEIAALAGDTELAMDLYDRAVKLAREGGFLYHEAEANELAGKYHLRKQRTAVARAYLQEAWYGYQQWGAKTKTRQLIESYPTLLGGVDQAAAASRTATSSAGGTTHSSTTDAARGLDLVTAVRATQALAGELELGTLLERLMRVIVENAGAQRGILVLNRDGRLEVEALVTVGERDVKLGLREPIERSTELATSVVQYVSRSKEALVLPDAAADPRFARDPYVAKRRPRSLLCLAMQHQGRLVGVLYLENNSATNAFSVDRVDLLQFIAAQAAVAVENATLYGELRGATEQLRQANDTLEAQVAERTEELRRTLAELWSEMDLARKIQTVLLPSETRFRDYEVSAMMVPASTVGGDYYDIIRTDGCDWVLIGDVSGHGVTAGLTMMMIQTAIRTVVLGGGPEAQKLTPAKVLSQVNSAVRENLRKVDEDHYMTITGLQLEGSSVRYSGLHQDILVYRAAVGTVERIETRGMWIGPFADIAPMLRDDTLELAHGDIVLLFTDGITEATIGGRRLGTDGLASVFHKLAINGSDNGGILRGIMQTMEGTQQDDVTMMAVRYLPEAA
jgi:predicted ATPase/serine phosphatase RsbU (regulator of sigma subunit)